LVEMIAETQSLCPVCLKRIPARKIEENGRIYLEKTCPEHGDNKILIWRQDARHYLDWAKGSRRGSGALRNYTAVERGCPFDCGLCSEHQTRACTMVMEVTMSCNLACPVCFASAGPKTAAGPDLETIRGMYKAVLDGVGVCTIQLSGGEPTLRDDLPQIAALGREAGFSHILINTNGVRIAQDRNYLKRLKESGASAIYLQFDGVSDEVYRSIRGRDLLEIKKRAIENCALAQIGVVLVPTIVPRINDQQLYAIIQFAKDWIPVVKGVHIQPVSYLGRYPHAPADEDRITIPDVIAALEAQSRGELKAEDFLPRQVDEPHCSFSGFFILTGEGKLQALNGPSGEKADPQSPTGEVPEEGSRRFMDQHWRINECCCQTGDKDDLLEQIIQNNLTISCMPFQDIWNLELDRLRACCGHLVTRERRIVPFCAYYLTGAGGQRLYPDV
jgi:7,8-dihydro-6-hydroxymethylpterin dimethyltransferase